MKRRFVYLLMFAAPTFLLSVVGAAVAAGLAVGVLWLFVFGDSPWPSWTDTAIPAAVLAVAAVLWVGQLAVAFFVGKQQERRPTLNRRHVALALGSTILLLVLIGARVMNVGTGPASDTGQCADFCTARGFAGSGMPPRNSGDRTCTCYDAQGRPALSMSLDSIGRR